MHTHKYKHTHFLPPHHVIGHQYLEISVLDWVDLWLSAPQAGLVI